MYVKDAGDCIDCALVTVANNYMKITNTTSTGANCSAIPSGSKTITASNGTLPYQYSLNANTGYQTSNTLAVFGGVSKVYVKDVGNCIDSAVVAGAINYVKITNTTSTAANCSTSPTGNITITANSGTPPYQYSLNANTGYQSSNVLNVFEETTKVYVKDAGD